MKKCGKLRCLFNQVAPHKISNYQFFREQDKPFLWWLNSQNLVVPFLNTIILMIRALTNFHFSHIFLIDHFFQLCKYDNKIMMEYQIIKTVIFFAQFYRQKVIFPPLFSSSLQTSNFSKKDKKNLSWSFCIQFYLLAKL